MQRLIKILQSYFLQWWTLSRPFYINHEIRCLPASYLFRLVINVQKKGTSLQYKIITHNYIHNSSLWQIPSFLLLLSFAFLLASFDFSYLDDIINCWSCGGKIRNLREHERGLFSYTYPAAPQNHLMHQCSDAMFKQHWDIAVSWQATQSQASADRSAVSAFPGLGFWLEFHGAARASQQRVCASRHSGLRDGKTNFSGVPQSSFQENPPCFEDSASIDKGIHIVTVNMSSVDLIIVPFVKTLKHLRRSGRPWAEGLSLEITYIYRWVLRQTVPWKLEQGWQSPASLHFWQIPLCLSRILWALMTSASQLMKPPSILPILTRWGLWAL